MNALFPLTFLLPFLAAVLVWLGAASGQYRRARWAAWLFGAAFALSASGLVQVATHGAFGVWWYDPANSSQLVLPLGYRIDRLAAVMMTLISGVGTLIFRFSLKYMYQEPGYGRFLALVGVTTSILLAMVASPNLVMLFVCWQLLSYLLYQLAHNLGHAPTRDGAIGTFRVLRFGDAVFLAGILLARYLYGTTEFSDLFARALAQPITLSPLPGLEIGGATAVALLVFLGAMGKSAQFPMHVWVPRSLYAPTPVTALLHAGIINACGFLVNRLAPLFGQSPVTLHVAFAIGSVTSILGASMMLVQNDIKRTLGFSTVGQMGYMVMECGLGAFSLAVFHLIAHGLFKAYAFLDCGNLIHKVRQEPSLPPGDPSQPDDAGLGSLTWITGFVTTLLLPLALLFVAHGALRIGLLESQGTVIFLFFSWVTSTQAILTLVRLRALSSWKVSVVMVGALLAVVFTYLFAATRFDAFLYPEAHASATYFRAAALPTPLFDGLVALTTVLFLACWAYVYATMRGRVLQTPRAIQGLGQGLYVLFVNQLYLDRLARRRPSPDITRTPSVGTAGLSLAFHAGLGVLPFAIAAALPHQAAACLGLAAAWWVLSWLCFDATHRVMYGR